ncbi:MltA domain-containing protein [Thalassotalea sp. Y01]|uniref:MltA domain-containing protein n=1 Tax=Thalassotalea sp. Y01 TaxID=2729613 RepID=UPI00145F7860|nr:acetate--CoA ligase [Thalassotalea sp. Y01]
MLKFFATALCLFSASCFASSAKFVLEANPQLGQMQLQKTSDLCYVAENTHKYLSDPQLSQTDKQAIQAGKVFDKSITLDRVKQTLTFLCKVYREDVRANRQSRLHDSDFVKQHFDFYRWSPDKLKADSIADNSSNEVKQRLLKQIPEEKLFITKYYTKRLQASTVKTAQHNQALYALPFDEQGMTKEQALEKKNLLTRFKYTRQDIINGALDKQNLAKPLVWLSEDALHDVLLQGTGVLDVDGKIRYFNVHRNNGISYDYALGKTEQKRYWYFAEVPGIMGYGEKIEQKIAVRPHVTFAGNVNDLGLGKLIMISYPLNQQQTSQLAILADTGGAFDNNLFQLDLLVDSYFGWQDYHAANKHLPDYANAWIMLLKQ